MSRRTALVTGASTGIGRATAEHLASQGWEVIATVRNSEDASGVAAPSIRPLLLDIAADLPFDGAVDEIDAMVGDTGIDLLVNNAAIVAGGPVEYLDLADWRSTFEVNFFGLIGLTRALFPLLRKAPDPRIVMVGSINCRIGVALLGPYVASKHALAGAVGCMRRELAGDGPMVSLIEPGAVKTPLWTKAVGVATRAESALPEAGRRRYRRFIAAQQAWLGDGEHRGVDPHKVATLVAKIADVERPRARYLVGWDARVAGGLDRVLPDRAMEWLAECLTARAT